MIHFIKQVDLCAARHVRAETTPDLRRAVITDYVPWERLPMDGFADLQYTETREDAPSYEIRLTVYLRSSIMLPSEPAVVRLTDIYGHQYIIGLPAGAPPYPVLELRTSAAAKPSETKPGTLLVTLKSQIPLIYVIL